MRYQVVSTTIESLQHQQRLNLILSTFLFFSAIAAIGSVGYAIYRAVKAATEDEEPSESPSPSPGPTPTPSPGPGPGPSPTPTPGPGPGPSPTPTPGDDGGYEGTWLAPAVIVMVFVVGASMYWIQVKFRKNRPWPSEVVIGAVTLLISVVSTAVISLISNDGEDNARTQAVNDAFAFVSMFVSMLLLAILLFIKRNKSKQRVDEINDEAERLRLGGNAEDPDGEAGDSWIQGLVNFFNNGAKRGQQNDPDADPNEAEQPN
nr:hypothetical protein [Sicyoidochytrium minutum DNA virus]